MFNILKPILSVFSKKLSEREKEWKSVLVNSIPKLEGFRNRTKLWFHSASMGEFEQAKPIIEYIKKVYPEFAIIVTFFSPSGFEHQKNYQYADLVLYLPFDTIKNSREFISIVQPNIAIFVRYELWLNFLYELNKKCIPTFLVCATKPFRLSNFFLYKIFLRYSYNLFSVISSSSEFDYEYFEKLKLKSRLELNYDTRFDRVNQKLHAPQNLPFSKNDFSNHFVLVAGSIWDKDIKIITDTLRKIGSEISFKVIYVPHEPEETRLQMIEKFDSNTIRLSKLFSINSNNAQWMHILTKNNIIVDSVGLLLDLYKIGDVAYVGGGFNRGVHSVIEPIGWGIPVICGGNISNSVEAIQMRDSGILKIVENSEDLELYLKELYFNKVYYENLKNMTKEYFNKRIGSTEKIVSQILKVLEKQQINSFRGNNF